MRYTRTSSPSGASLSVDAQDLLSQLEALLVAERDVRVPIGVYQDPTVLLKNLVCALCDYPEAVHVVSLVTAHSASFEIHVHREDVSKVLGSGGSYAFALRTLFTAIYGKGKKKLNLLVVDPQRRR